MAVQSQIFPITTDGVTTFTSTKHIPTKAHVAIWLKNVSDGAWEQLGSDKYDMFSNTVVLNDGLVSTIVESLELRVADTEDELATSLSDIAKVADLNSEIERLSESANAIDRLEESADNIDRVYDSIDNIDINANNITDINITANAISGGGTTTGGQFTGGGLTKPLIYTSKIVTEDTTIANGTNALAIDTLEVADGVELTIADGSVIKVV